MDFPFEPPLAPMEAKVQENLPLPPGWAYEPKWDGFRFLGWAGDPGRLDSRNGRPLLRYFPELRPALAQLPPATVVDGEIVVVREGVTDFDLLQNRLHPAESRVRMLADRTPAELVAFDLLALKGEDLRGRPFSDRRALLVELCGQLGSPWHLTPSTHDVEVARSWFMEFESAGCDGIVAKRLERAYIEGKREMVKVKHRRSVDAVVGGYRVHKEGDRVGSILLGLYDPSGELHFIGHCSGFSVSAAVRLLDNLLPLRDESSFGEHARRPGAESRWSAGKDLAWTPVRPEMVVQVTYDQLQGERFRHATRFERWRPDKDPTDCTMEQLERPEGTRFESVVGARRE
jgi:ATP-dependent DNA ligase